MTKSSTCCLGGVMLIVSLALNVAFLTGCVSVVSVDGDFPFIHIESLDKSKNVESLKKEVESLKKERVASLERLRTIANELGVDTKDIDDEVVLKGEIMQRLLGGRTIVPECDLNDDDIARIGVELMRKKTTVLDTCRFVMKLKGKKVIVIERGTK